MLNLIFFTLLLLYLIGTTGGIIYVLNSGKDYEPISEKVTAHHE